MAARTSTDVNRSRERARQEAASLRATVAELEAELEQIRSQHEAAQVLAVASAGDASVRAQAIENAAWQVMAERQRRLRYDAEIENSKLRSGLEDLLRVGRALEKLLHRRQHADVESMLERRLGNPSRMTTQSLLDDPAIVEDLKASLASQLADAHKVFMNESFTHDDGPFRHINVRCQGEAGTYVEVSERRILPFDEQIISAALLQHFQTQHPVASSGPAIRVNGESIEYDIMTMIDTVRFRGITRTKLFVQRVVMGGTTFFIFAGIADPGESLGASSCQGLYVRHHGWTRLRAVPQSKDTPLNSTITEYAYYHVATPELHDAEQDQRRKIGTLTNYVLATLGFQLDGVRESVDNYALAYAMASPSPSLGVSLPSVQTLVSQ